ncbi:MAG: NADH-quinone oxidoreductase subunit [Actinomycetota bacterium]|nr:NADH-quinone oxidoreductase subunit [Actinomycetota bacterium]
MIDWVVFSVAALAVLSGALGVVLSTHPVHAALMLVLTLFGVAVLFVAQGAHFLAAVQVIVYAGAIVVLFLFVIMLLGVDKSEDLRSERLKGQRPVAVVAGLTVMGAVLLMARSDWVSGARSTAGSLGDGTDNVVLLARSLFTRYLLAFEATSVLLVIAVVGAVVLVRRSGPLPEAVDETMGARPSSSGAGA